MSKKQFYQPISHIKTTPIILKPHLIDKLDYNNNLFKQNTRKKIFAKIKNKPIPNSNQKTYLKGLTFTIKGRLKGARRARTLKHKYGSIGPNTFNKRSQSNQQVIFTKWGTWSLKTSLSRTYNGQKL